MNKIKKPRNSEFTSFLFSLNLNSTKPITNYAGANKKKENTQKRNTKKKKKMQIIKFE
jgi:hypothetical protein